MILALLRETHFNWLVRRNLITVLREIECHLNSTLSFNHHKSNKSPKMKQQQGYRGLIGDIMQRNKLDC